MVNIKKLLTKILDKLQPQNYTIVGTGSISSITATTSKLVQTVNHISNTGKIFILADFPLHTSRYTSNISIRVNGVTKQSRGTNIQPNPNINVSDRVILSLVCDVPIGENSVIEFYLQGQDSGTTATIPGYRGGTCQILDIMGGGGSQ